MRVRNPKAIGELGNEGERSDFRCAEGNVPADDECKELLSGRTGWRGDKAQLIVVLLALLPHKQ
jgi:hypothetical protein